MILKGIKALIILVIFPELLGMLITKFENKQYKVFLNYIYGIMIEFAVCEIFAVPLIMLKTSFTTLLVSWLCIIFALSMLSIFINRKFYLTLIPNLKNKFKEIKWKELYKNIPWAFISLVVLVTFQTYVLVVYTHIDDDDARFVTYATLAVQQDKMYTEGFETGTEYDTIMSNRDVLSPFPMYTAIVSKIIDLHPAAVAHVVFPAFLIPLAYMVYWQLGYKLFKEDSNKTNVFCIIISVIYMFGDFSTRANFVLLLYRIWQGKAILGNIILPMIWFMLYDCITDNRISKWIVLYITIIAGCFVSQMGIGLIPISVGILSLIFMIKYRKLNYVIKSVCAILPCLIYLLLYVIIK